MVQRTSIDKYQPKYTIIDAAIPVHLPQAVVIWSRGGLPMSESILICRLGGAGPGQLTDCPEGFAVDAMFYREKIIVYFSRSGPVELDFFPIAFSVEVDELDRE